MAILPKDTTQQETTASLSTSNTAANYKPRAAPSRRQAPRHDSGNLSLSDASTTSLSSSSSTAASPPQQPKKSRRNRRGGRSNKAKNGSQKNHQQPIEPLSEAEQARYVALDCEFVGVGYLGRQSILARVSLVDWNGNVVLDEYVQPTAEVTDYRTFVSGITAEHLASATHTFASIRSLVQELLTDKVLIGHGLKSDLSVLQIQHPWYDVRDTAKYEPFMQVRFQQDGILWPRKLRDLCAARPNLDVPTDFQTGQHCSVADAIAALRLYQSVRNKWEKCMDYKKSKTLQILQQQRHLSSSDECSQAPSSGDEESSASQVSSSP